MNIGRIPKKRINFPEGVIRVDGRIDFGELEGLVSKIGLFTFIGDDVKCSDFGLGRESYDRDSIQIGLKINSTYDSDTKVDGKHAKIKECTFFDVNQIIALRQNPSELIAGLKEIGLDVMPKELALYGVELTDLIF